MPKFLGYKERRHQCFYDTLIRADTTTAPSPTVQSSTQLFNGTNLGQEAWTNMSVAGQFPSDNSYIALALRCYVWYQGASALLMYQLTMNQLFLQFTVADKPQISGPAWYWPQGGGVFGFDSTTPAMTNGVPSVESILKFAKPIPIPSRQNIKVLANLYATGNTDLRATYLNSASYGMREIKVVIDGLETRDVL